MKSGYNIRWTENALDELQETFDYLEENWTEKELHNLSVAIQKTIDFLSENPTLFPVADKIGVRKAVVLKLNTIYYRIVDKDVEILSFFLNRKDPKKRKI
jgi:plasmid stabilization system protein ParE